MTHCLVGQHATNGPAQFAFARQLLQGQELKKLKNAADSKEGETLFTFKELLKASTLNFFLKKSLVTQHRYMRQFLCNPWVISVK